MAGIPATNCGCCYHEAIIFDAGNDLLIADSGDGVHKVGTNNLIITIVGDGTTGYSGNGGPAANSTIAGTVGVAVDNFGNIFVADSHKQRIHQVTPNGTITTVAGNGTNGYG